MTTIRPCTAALALALSLAACGGTPDAFLSVSGGGGATADRTRPTIVGTTPERNATNVPLNTLVVVTFSEPVDSSNALSVALSDGTTGQLYITGASVTFAPSHFLPPATTITATVSGARDRAGNTLAAPYSWSFRTAAVGP